MSPDDPLSQYVESQSVDSIAEVNKLLNNKTVEAVEYKNQCILCRKVLSSSKALKAHYPLHTGIFPLTCRICNFGAVNRTHIKYHLLSIHKIDVAYQKKEEKGKTKNKTVRKSFHSPTIVANWEVYLKVHEKKVTALKEMVDDLKNEDAEQYNNCVCCRCGLKTVKKELLNQHFLVHVDICPYKCRLCKRRFVLKGSVKTHLRNKHRKEFEECLIERNEETEQEEEKEKVKKRGRKRLVKKEEPDHEIDHSSTFVPLESEKQKSLRVWREEHAIWTGECSCGEYDHKENPGDYTPRAVKVEIKEEEPDLFEPKNEKQPDWTYESMVLIEEWKPLSSKRS